ncbi:MAG: ABC transporter ATP-binding protein [Pseudomonadota bacterium]
MLEAHDLSVSLKDGDRAFRLRIEGLRVDAGEAVGLTGPSGTGKTLLLELLGLLRRPDPGGTYSLRSEQMTQDLTASWTASGALRAELRGSVFGFVPQTGGLVPFLSLRQNIELTQDISGRFDKSWVDQLLTQLGLDAVAHMRPDKLSIGQRQRTAIARALAHRPQVIIADEPTAALDPESAQQAMGLLIDAAKLGGTAVMISSHDLALLDRFPLTRYGLKLTPATRPGLVTSRLRPLKVLV